MEIDRERLAEIAQQFGLDLIVLFGSHAKDRARPGSDLDVAVRAIQRPWGECCRIRTEGCPRLLSEPLSPARWPWRPGELTSALIPTGHETDCDKDKVRPVVAPRATSATSV